MKRTVTVSSPPSADTLQHSSYTWLEKNGGRNVKIIWARGPRHLLWDTLLDMTSQRFCCLNNICIMTPVNRLTWIVKLLTTRTHSQKATDHQWMLKEGESVFSRDENININSNINGLTRVCMYTVIIIENVMNLRGSGGTWEELREKGCSNDVNMILIYKILKIKNNKIN